MPILHNEFDYSQTLAKVQKLTESALSGKDDRALTRKQQHDLRVAALQVQGMIDFHPEYLQNYYLEGRIAFALQDYPTAELNFLRCISVAWEPGQDQKFFLDTNTDAHYMLSRCYFLQNNYQPAADEALIAVRRQPKSVLYRVAEAEAEAQMHHDIAAKGILRDALRLDPHNERALMLYAFIESNPSPSPLPVKKRATAESRPKTVGKAAK